MALQAHRTMLLPRKLLSFENLLFLRAASTATVAGTYPYDIPTSFTPPPYPYGPSINYRRRDSGLYGATTIQYGNLVSEQNEHKSRRVWRPNVHKKKLWSNFLGRFVQVKVVTRVLRTIDKVGGLDEYLVGSDAPARIKELGVTGWKLRWRVMQTRGYKERAAAERRALGLPLRGWGAAEKERKSELRREGMRIAEAYLVAAKIDANAQRRSVAENAAESEGDLVNFMKEDGALTMEQEEVKESDTNRLDMSTKEQEQTQKEHESEFDVIREQDEPEGEVQNEVVDLFAGPIDPAVSTLPQLSASEQLFIQLTAIAAQISTTPDILIARTRAMIDNRTAQLADAAERRTQLANDRAAIVSEIDDLLASSRSGSIMKFHGTHLRIARSENALQREQEGKPPLALKQIELNVTGPPSNIPADKWAQVHARVKAIRRAEPRRLQEVREQRMRNIESNEQLVKIRGKGEGKARFVGAKKVEKGLWNRIRGLFGRKKSDSGEKE